MRTKRLAIPGAIALSLSLAAAAQETVRPGRESATPRDPSRAVPVVNVTRRGTLEVSADLAQPIPGIPRTGIGLPPGIVDDGGEVIQRPRADLPPEFIGRQLPAKWYPPDGAAGRDSPVIFNFESIGPNGLDPPDPDLAVGPNHIVAITNDDFAIYDKCGVQLFREDIETFLGVDTAFLVFDPKVIYDPWDNRWVMLWHKKREATEESTFALVVSAGATPWGLGDWWWYDFQAVQDGGTDRASWADYYDLGYSPDFLQASGNQFEFPDALGNQPFRWSRLVQWRKDQVYNQVGAQTASFWNLTNPSGSQTFAPRAAKQQVSLGSSYDGLFFNSRPGGSTLITMWKWEDAFGANNLTATDITVDAYDNPPDAVQPDGNLLDVIDSRLMPCVLTQDLLGDGGIRVYTSLNELYLGNSACRLFAFDPVAATVTFQFSFHLTDWSYWFACPAADYAGNCFWVFTRTANIPGAEAEIRFVDTQFGEFTNASSALKDGEGSIGPCLDDSGNLIGCRWGDYFGGQLDWGDYFANLDLPGDPAKVWLYAEYGKTDSWGTHVGATSNFAQGDLSSVNPSSTWVISAWDGGFFDSTSRTYTLSNTGEVGLGWEVTGLASWLTVNAERGVAYPGDTNVTVFLDTAEARNFVPGTYNDTYTIRDCYNRGRTYNRSVQLVIKNCVADFNNDGRINVFDFLAYQSAFGNGDPDADLAPPLGILNLFDFLAFQTEFGNGC